MCLSGSLECRPDKAVSRHPASVHGKNAGWRCAYPAYEKLPEMCLSGSLECRPDKAESRHPATAQRQNAGWRCAYPAYE